MKKTAFALSLFLMLLLASCSHSFNSTLSDANLIMEAAPDSALTLLGEKEHHKKRVTDIAKQYFDNNSNHINWGNIGALAELRASLDNTARFTSRAYWTRYSSRYKQLHEYQSSLADPATYGYNLSQTKNEVSTLGVQLDYAKQLQNRAKLMFGVQWDY